MPTLRQLQYFLAIVEDGGLTQASARLHVAQSALSRQMALLEEELGFSLFDREPRGVRLTAAGTAYRDRIQSIPRTLARAAEESLLIAQGGAGVLRLLHSSTIPVRSLLPALDGFAARCPLARVDLDRESSEQQIGEVAEGRADIGVIRLPVLRRDARVRLVELGTERLWVALPANHPRARRDSIAMKSLREEPFVSAPYHERGGLGRVVLDLCLRHGYAPRLARITSPKTSMLDLVAAGRGVAIVPERMVTPETGGVTFLRLRDESAVSVCAIVLPLRAGALGQVFADILLGAAPVMQRC